MHATVGRAPNTAFNGRRAGQSGIGILGLGRIWNMSAADQAKAGCRTAMVL
ncbi:hypothetical protein K4F84_13015 [Phaeobacter inhibens]|uniref:hypothetical protein n=1 Tax=Phaeobacter inhibens TaxID=221822 RepID=UPI0021A271A5|nr:hypothetical protein [Phaeobacter inhibens]UWR54818.1 hypothetical protein K4F84_13015 [Phaeobacter inhibens]UWS05947.1 hypothetical protein K4K94_13070 [Phaeobacter inhibens]